MNDKMTRAFKKPLQRSLFINSNISQLNLVATLEQANEHTTYIFNC